MIILAPYARALRNGGNNPKNYPFWDRLVPMLKDVDSCLIQVGPKTEALLPGINELQSLNVTELEALVRSCDTWISVDSFFQHFCWDLGKPGVVLWGQSDPLIFGHPENINLLKSRKHLREKQFWLWEQTPYVEEAFVDPIVVIEAVHTLKRT